MRHRGPSRSTWGQLITLSPCHPVTPSPCHLVTLSPRHPVILPPCHPVTPSHPRRVFMSSKLRLFWLTVLFMLCRR